ncbi:phosphomannomutase CpsG, partial [Salmonella enterica subsp. enterica serovar Enteritidis]|nr:phosphomannomutase CpsG [Salmonella enterica subsp. enterica serovar Enteritidis]EGU4335042.1 phosphomannomutase CpsG [Salmonella enterica]
GEALAVDRTDGISMSFADWRFNLRSSNTEPVIRLNVETKKNNELLNKQTAFVISLLRNKNNDTK